MKRKALFLLFAMVLGSAIVAGQSRYYNKGMSQYSYGVKAGVNWATQSSHGSDTVTQVRSIYSFNAGGWFTYRIQKKLFLQTELIISGKGSHWKDPYQEMTDLPFYADIPVLIKFQPVDYISIIAGPQAGFRIVAKQKNMETGEKQNINSYYNFAEVGVVMGAEADLPNRLYFTVRYILGITSATSSIEYINPWYNNFLQVSVGYRLSGKSYPYRNRYRR